MVAFWAVQVLSRVDNAVAFACAFARTVRAAASCCAHVAVGGTAAVPIATFACGLASRLAVTLAVPARDTGCGTPCYLSLLY